MIMLGVVIVFLGAYMYVSALDSPSEGNNPPGSAQQKMPSSQKYYPPEVYTDQRYSALRFLGPTRMHPSAMYAYSPKGVYEYKRDQWKREEQYDANVPDLNCTRRNQHRLATGGARPMRNLRLQAFLSSREHSPQIAFKDVPSTGGAITNELYY